MFPHSIVNTSSTATGNYYEQALSLPSDQSFSFHDRPFASEDNITPIYNPSPNCTADFISSNSWKQDQNLEQGPQQHHIHPPLSFYYFPSPFENYDAQLHHEPFTFQESPSSLAHHHHHQQAKMVDWESNKKDQKKGDEQQQQQQQKKVPAMRRTSKKDRHSKINTARGPRDRRMRLSLMVARRFFGLQDMLGYDKASKTVEWLLNQAEAEINKVTREYCRKQRKNQSSPTTAAAGTGARTTSASTSECEVVSGLDEAANDNFVDKVSSKSPSSCVKQRMKKIVRQQKKSAMFNPLRKESREKARARARERTKEKQCLSSAEEASGGFKSYNITNYITLESLTETEEPISSLQAAGTCSTFIGHHPHIHQELATVDDHDAASNLVMMGKWSPSSMFNYQLQHTPGSSSQEHHQFADFQFFGKPWEVYNSSTHNSPNLF